MRKALKITAIVLIAATALPLFAACGGLAQKTFGKDSVGEVYYTVTPEEHIQKNGTGMMYADNEVLVTAKSGVEKSEMDALAVKYGAEIVGYIEFTGDYQWKLKKAYTYDELKKTVERLKNEDVVESAELSHINRYGTQAQSGPQFKRPNDQLWENEWDMLSPGGRNWGVEAIRAPYVWNFTDRMNPVRVGLIDGMFNTQHEDLAFAETFDNPGQITNAHGSHVAGTMAATFDNGTGIAGVYPFGRDKQGNNNIYAVAVNGTGDYNDSNLFQLKVALANLILRDVKVINYSRGFETAAVLAAKDESGYREMLKNGAKSIGDFLEKFLDEGYDFVITSSAGNDKNMRVGMENGKWVRKPEGFPRKKGWIYGGDYNNLADWSSYFTIIENERVKDRIIVVGAAGSKRKGYKIADFSNTGSRVDVMAPGVNIESATFGTNGYEQKMGTSMAAPHVAGAAATVWSANNSLSGAKVKEIIKKSCIIDVDGTSVKMLNMLYAFDKTMQEKKGKSPLHNEESMLTAAVRDAATILKENVEVKLLDESDNVLQTAITASDGTFEFLIPSGKYKLKLSLAGYASRTIDNITVAPGDVVRWNDIVLYPLATDFTLPGEMVVTLGEINVIEPETIPTEARGFTMRWSSSDESVATVSPAGEAGIVTALAKGTATITAKLTSGKNTITRSTRVRVCSKARDTVLVLDVSGSMSGTPMREMKKSAIRFCDDLLSDEYNNRVALVFYDTETWHFDFTSNMVALSDVIDSVSDGNMTNMEGGLSSAEWLLDNYGRDGAIKNVVIMADGLPNEGATSLSGSMPDAYYDYHQYVYASAVIDTAQSIMSKYNLYSLGFFHSLSGEGKSFGEALMQKLTNKEDGYHSVDRAEDLQFAFGDVSENINKGSKIVINIACPVDVRVTYGKETLSSMAASFSNQTSFGTLQLLGREKDIKVLSLDSDKKYKIELLGNDCGTMDFSVNYFDDDDRMFDYRSFENVPVTETTVIKSDISHTPDAVSLNVDENGDGEVDIIWGAPKKSKGKITYEKKPVKEETTPEPTAHEAVPTWGIALMILGLIIILGLLTIILVFASSQGKEYTEDDLPEPPPYEPPTPPVKPGEAGIRIISGTMQNTFVPIEDGETLYLGRNPKYANIVFTEDYRNVSGIHCAVTYKAKSQNYYVTDSSANGTFFANKQQLVKGKRTAVEAGATLILANEDCMIVLE